MNQKQASTIGVDLGDKFHVAVAIDQAGKEHGPYRIRNASGPIQHFFGKYSACRVIVETGSLTAWVGDLIEQLGHEVVVADARRIPHLEDRGRIKNDHRDARSLALLGASDLPLLHPVRRRGAQARADLELLKARDALVRHRTGLVNHVRSVCKAFGTRLATCSSRSFRRQASGQIPELIGGAMEPLLVMIEMLSDQIDAIEERLERIAEERYPEASRLRQIAGVGAITSMAYITTLEDPGRFKKSRTVGAYLGLVPTENSSGATRSQGGITKTGNTHARRLLVEAAWHHRRGYRPSRDLRRRWEAAPPAVQTRAHVGNRRMHDRWAQFDARKKRPVVANAAIARELAGWCWSLAVLDE